MTNRYADNIRRIVGTEADKKGLSAAPEKPSISSFRGIGYMTNQNTAAGTGTNSPGSQTPDAILSDVNVDFENFKKRTQTQLESTDGDSNTEIDPNTGTATNGARRTDTAGVKDAENLFDGDTDQTKQSSRDNSEYSQNNRNNENTSTLNGITGLGDPNNSDEAVRLVFHSDNYPIAATLDQLGNTLHQAFDALNAAGDYDAPEIYDFQSGYYWEVAGSGNPSPEQGAGPQLAAEAAKTYLDANPPGGRFGPFSIIEMVPSGSPATSYTIKYQDGAVPGAPGQFTLTMARIDCVGTPPDDAGSCPAQAPVETKLPDGTAIQIRYDKGLFKTSSLSDNASLNLSHRDKSRVNLSFGSGRFMSAEAGKDGGFLIYETATEGAAPSGNVYVYGPNRQLQHVVGAAFIDNYRP